jgi:hypothetical protein
MRRLLACAFLGALFAAPASAATPPACGAGDMVLGARTPEVDLYDAAGGKRVQTMDAKTFPTCTKITGRAPNMMLQVAIGGKQFWVPPHMVAYHFDGKLPQVCRNLAMGSNQVKVGATRGLGESCPKTGGK